MKKLALVHVGSVKPTEVQNNEWASAYRIIGYCRLQQRTPKGPDELMLMREVIRIEYAERYVVYHYENMPIQIY